LFTTLVLCLCSTSFCESISSQFGRFIAMTLYSVGLLMSSCYVSLGEKISTMNLKLLIKPSVVVAEGVGWCRRYGHLVSLPPLQSLFGSFTPVSVGLYDVFRKVLGDLFLQLTGGIALLPTPTGTFIFYQRS
jgi:hypothetical protein